MSRFLSNPRHGADKAAAWFARLDDLVGAVALFALLAAGIWLSYGAGLPTGGVQLLQEVR